MNNEGYEDPTAERAIRNVMGKTKDTRNIIKILNAVANLAGFKIAKIIIKDIATGKEYD